MYIARPPISLNKIILEDYHGKVLFHTSYNEYFPTVGTFRPTVGTFRKENLKLFDALDFIALLSHPAQGDTPYPTLRLIQWLERKAYLFF